MCPKCQEEMVKASEGEGCVLWKCKVFECGTMVLHNIETGHKQVIKRNSNQEKQNG